MWSYYGSKCKIAKHYPKPQENLIIEPFAGAAWYSVHHRTNSVWVNEKNKTIADIWKWIINHATADDILQSTDFYHGDDIRDLSVLKEHRDLLGFIINRGSVAPRNIVQKWSCQSKSRPQWASSVSFQLHRIASYLEEIRHWKPICGDYRDLPNVKATWFIDPPYQHGGELYIEHQIDYKKLAEWCKERKGQVIVCENSKANWLPFEPFIKTTGQRKKTAEVIWEKNDNDT